MTFPWSRLGAAMIGVGAAAAFAADDSADLTAICVKARPAFVFIAGGSGVAFMGSVGNNSKS